MIRVVVVWSVGIALAVGSPGCGGGGPVVPAKEALDKQASAKLEAMKQLVEAVEKHDQSGINAGVEGITAMSMDAKAQPEVAREIVTLYKTKVKGKLKGEAAAQLQVVIDGLEKELK